MRITTFQSESKSKIPISPYNDGTFDFITYDTDLENAYRLMCTNFILNLPLKVDDFHSSRKKRDLESAFAKTFDYVVLDIDKIKSLEDRNKVLNYFREYTCILGESRSYDGIENFNLKGILQTEDLDYHTLRLAISKIHADLQDVCDVDECVTRYTTLNAPIKKFNVLMHSSGSVYRYTYTHVGSHNLTSMNVNIADIQNVTYDNSKSVDELCLCIFQDMGFKAISNSGDAVYFSHPSEKKTIGGFFWFKNSPFIMHHFNPSRNVNIYEHVKKLQIYKDLLKKEINYQKQFEYPEVCTNVINVDERYLKVTPEINTAINNFLYGSDGVFKIKSPMGTAKSTIISCIIKKSLDMDARVLVLSNRRSTANDFYQKYSKNGLKLYSKDKYKIGDSLICQYDSLWKYNIRFFDVVILDEFMSLLLHSRSALNNCMFNISKFYGLFQKKLVIADAFLTGYENVFLDHKKENCYLLNNNYRDDTVVYQYNNFNNFVFNILKICKNNKCTISATSLNFIHGLKLLFKKYNIRTITLTADTSDNTKNLIYKEFEKFDNDKWDVLIYSPTLTVGVSNLNNVRYHFHYDTSTTDTIGSLQMLKRSRNAKEIHLYVKSKTNYVKTTYDEIRDEYLSNATKSAEMNCLFELDNYGEIRISNIGRKAILIDTFKNILEYNHLDAFRYLAKLHFKNDFIEINDCKETNILLPYIRENKQNTLNVQKELILEFLKLNEFAGFMNTSEFDNVTDYKTLSEIDMQIKSSLDCNISKTERYEMLLLGLKSKGFIEHCKNWYYAYEFSQGNLGIDDLKNVMTECAASQKNINLINVLTKLIDLNKISLYQYKTQYTPKEFNDISILADVGYVRCTENAKVYYALDDNVKKYYQYIKV